MAEISSKVWLIVGAIITIVAFALNIFTSSLKFTIFVISGIIMVIISVARYLAEQNFEKEKKKLDEIDKREELISQQKLAAMEREHKSRMQNAMRQQQERYLAGQHPQMQGMRQCPRCGSSLNSTDRFCFSCGTRQF